MKTIMKTRSLLPLLLFSCTLLTLGSCTTSEVGKDSPNAELPAANKGAQTSNSSARLPAIRLSRASVSIGSLTAEQADDTVTISGTVAQRVPLLEGWLYEVSDDSGSLWVLSDKSAPAVGETATVDGVVRYEAIVVGEIDAGEVYLQEASSRQEPRQEDRPGNRLEGE